MNKETHLQTYVEIMTELAQEIKQLDGYKELLGPFIPGVGKTYWENQHIPKIAFVGKDLGQLKKIGDSFDDLLSYISFYSEVLNDLDIIDSWPTHNGTFGLMILEVLSTIYGVTVDELKRGNRTDILTSFVWSQTEAVQNFEAANITIPHLTNEVWQSIKQKAQHLNSLSLLLKTTNPDIVIITSWNIDEYFDVDDFVVVKDEYHLRLLKHSKRNQYIIHTSHPRSWPRDPGFEEKPFEKGIARIISQLNENIQIQTYFK